MTHAKGRFRILRVVVEDTFALVNHLLILLNVQLTESKIASAAHLALLCHFGLSELCVKSDCINGRKVLLTGTCVILLPKQAICLCLYLLCLVKVDLLVGW